MKVKSFFSIRGTFFILALFFGVHSMAQQTAIYDNPEARYKLGLELFNKEKYAGAQHEFDKIIASIKTDASELKTNSEYYSSICALELFNDDAEFRLSQFIKNHPTSAKTGRAYFQLGRYQFRNRDYRDALKSFRDVNKFDLSRDEKTEYDFKTGFCYMQKKDLKNAKKMLDKVKGGNNKFKEPATYYCAHIEYENGDYEPALKGFEKLKNHRTFSKIIPYYILHIYYYQGNYAEILKNGPELYEKANNKRKSEIARIIGDAYYRAGDFGQAIKYLEDYKLSARKSLSREDNYQIAYAYFETGKYKKAIDHFQDVISVKDSLSQNAYYHLADCYLKTDQKKYAANAFLSVYKMDFDKKIQEDALFNYAKLSIEVAHNPYNESIKYLEKYIASYPNSKRLPEAYNLLAQLYLSTKNYKAALTSIEKIKVKNENLKRAYQKITYYRGIELFNNRKYKEAIDLFKAASQYHYEPLISAQADYWMGESFYRLKNWWGAMKYYNSFLKNKNARSLPEYAKAHYNLGYTYFKRKDYSGAVDNFKNFIKTGKNTNPNLTCDAYLRLGDCYFINKRYQTAIDYYNESLALKRADQDYALYQKAMSFGALANFRDKISTLDRLVRYNKKSPYYDEALYEIATSNLIMNDNKSALVNFDKLVREQPKSPYARKSLLKSGLIYYNNDQNQNAIKLLKQVTENYPNTAEARDALASLKNIYIDMNKVDAYFAYTKDLPNASVSTSEQDSLTYIAAENIYMSNRCEDAVPAFEKYIENFPNGAFLVNVHYYKADCEIRASKQIAALEDLEYVIGQATNTFTENALLKASGISYRLKMYENAYKHFDALKNMATSTSSSNVAIEGKMNSSYYSDNYEQAIDAAKNLLQNEKVSIEQSLQAHFILGKCYLALDQKEDAGREFNIVDKLTTNELGAESKYFTAWFAFETNDYAKTEEIIFQMVDEYSSYDYWVAKSFILLADVYAKQDNMFQAKQTLQSIIENYSGEDLRKVAQQRLKKISDQENEAKKPVETNDGEEF
jgi:TolA-binding protein